MRRPLMVPELVLVVVLVAVNAVLSGSEIALISLREPQLVGLERRGGGAAVAASLARDPNRFLATIQIGITLAGFLASAVAAVTLAEPLVPVFSVFGDAAQTVAVVCVTIVLAFVTLVFGELVPKRLALLHPVGWAVALGRPLHVLATVATPIVWLLSVTTDAFVRVLGGGRGGSGAGIHLAELRELVLATGQLPADHHEVLLGAVEVTDRSLVGVMTPRPDVRTLEVTMSVSEAIGVLAAEGFTRMPVTTAGGGLDAAVGVASLQDLVRLDPDEPIGNHVRAVPSLPEGQDVLVALRHLQAGRHPMAFVIDEFGGVEGIVTVEDLVEELVGEIYDEADAVVGQPRLLADGTYVVPGRFPVHDLADHGIEVPRGEYATVAGLVLEAAAEIPEVGQSVQVGDWDITVTARDDNAITSVRFARRGAA